MTHVFAEQLDRLKAILLSMGGQAESVVNRALKAVLERDDELARQVQEDDNLLDDMEVQVDEMAIGLLSQAPLATDLRLIAVGMKISGNLERVGDEATKVARRAVELAKEPPLGTSGDLPRMAEQALLMLGEALDAFVHHRPDQARQVVLRDKQVDELNRQVHRELVNRMVTDPSTINRCLHLMVISKALERIADHACNIAEEVVYLEQALDIRHTQRREGA